jgi:two-component system response regulator FixJ
VSQVDGQAEVALPVGAYAEEPSSSDVVEAMLAGALGYLKWPFDERELNVTLKRVSNEAARTLNRRRAVCDATSRVNALSRREKQVLTGLIGGLSNRAIAQTLAISPRTVEIHRSNMMNKLRARSVADAVRVGLYAGLDEA